MRYVVVGAGAVGGTIGGRLFQHGHEVVLVARGAHYRAMRERGLRFASPEETVELPIPVVESPEDLQPREDDVVVLAVKTQDSAAALAALAQVAYSSSGWARLPIVCAQNGVDNERQALRLFDRVYGMCVRLPASYLEPGVVAAEGTPISGVLDVGRYPSGLDEVAVRIVADLAASRFSAEAHDDVMRWKYRKLLSNLGNALDAAVGRASGARDLLRRAADEGQECFAAAGIEVATEEEDERRRAGMGVGQVEGRQRSGSSSWQSLARGTGSIESDYLNGEIALLGRLHAVPTPINSALQRVAASLAYDRRPPGSLTLDEVLAAVGE